MRDKLLIAIIIILGVGCSQFDTSFNANEPYPIEIPNGFPAYEIPDDNPMTEFGVQLGKVLFFDQRLSRDQSVSCASCHLQELAFTDGFPQSVGIDGRIGLRNAPTLANVAWHERLFMDGGVPSLELQVLAPITSEDEMDFTVDGALKRLEADDEIQILSNLAYGRNLDAFVLTRAIASFERTLISGNSDYDDFLYNGNSGAFSDQELAGYQIFVSEDANCSSCHSGHNLTDNDYHNIGLYEVYSDSGRERISLSPEDDGKFKTPSLRNILLTAPYMHDGSLSTLNDVLDHFSSGGAGHVNQDDRIVPLNFNAQEREQLIAFFGTLTDDEFVSNPAHVLQN